MIQKAPSFANTPAALLFADSIAGGIGTECTVCAGGADCFGFREQGSSRYRRGANFRILKLICGVFDRFAAVLNVNKIDIPAFCAIL